MISKTPNPPYYAVIFSSIRNENDDVNYSEMSDKMTKMVSSQEGFLGVETARGEVGITVSYWKDLESIKNWRNNIAHITAREKGRSTWYKSFKVRITKVERDYEFFNQID